MLNHQRLSIERAILLVAGCAIPAFPGTTVTIANQSGKDLMIARAGGKADCPILVTDQCDNKDGKAGPHALCRLKARPRTPMQAAAAAELFGPDSEGPAPARDQFLLLDGHSATLAFENPGEAMEAELVLYRLDGADGIAFSGIVILAFAPRAPGLPDSPGPEPEARLRLPGGPTPGTRSLPCNRNLKLVSGRELQVLPPAGRAEAKSGAVSPLGLDLEP